MVEFVFCWVELWAWIRGLLEAVPEPSLQEVKGEPRGWVRTVFRAANSDCGGLED